MISVVTKLEEIAESMKTEITDKIADEIQANNKRLSASTANQQAREKVENMWHRNLEILSGKEILHRLNIWSNQNYKASIMVNSLASELQFDEIPEEMASVITAIEKNYTF